MPLIDNGDKKLWRRDPLQQVVARDLVGMTATYMRACTASREYVVVKVPIVDYSTTGEPTLNLLHHSEDERRFVLENITPREYERNQAAKINDHRHDAFVYYGVTAGRRKNARSAPE